MEMNEEKIIEKFHCDLCNATLEANICLNPICIMYNIIPSKRGRPPSEGLVHGKLGTYVNRKCRCELCRRTMVDYVQASRSLKRV